MNCCSTRGPCQCRTAMGTYPSAFNYTHAVAYGRGRRVRRSLLGRLGDAGLPAGSRLAYTATWADSKAQLNNPDAVQAQIQTLMAQQDGIVIDGQQHSQSDYFNFSGQQTMTLQVHTISDRDSGNDVKAIIDGWIYKVTGSMPVSKILVVTFAGGPSQQLPWDQLQPPPPKPPTDLGQWLSDNWWVIALAIGGVVVAEDLI